MSVKYSRQFLKVFVSHNEFHQMLSDSWISPTLLFFNRFFTEIGEGLTKVSKKS